MPIEWWHPVPMSWINFLELFSDCFIGIDDADLEAMSRLHEWLDLKKGTTSEKTDNIL